MPAHRMLDMTWEEVRDLDRARTVALLPVGAVEAHGPHLPLGTDCLIAEAMADAGAERLRASDLDPLVLPTVQFTSASFAAAFPGTVSLSPQAVAATVADIGRALARHGFGTFALANAHLDPVHLGALRRAVDALEADDVPLRVAFPDLTRKPWALRLTDEFQSGACHAGRYEGSIVLACRPEWVRSQIAAGLPANPASLSAAIRDGKTSFVAAGGPRAYFGAPAEASAAEGHETIAALGGILHDAVIEVLAVAAPDAPS